MEDNFTTIKEFVDSIFEKYPQNIAYRFFRDEVIEDRTYTDLRNDVYGLASYFVKNGCTGKHIAIIGSTSYEWVVSFLAIIISSNVAVPIALLAVIIVSVLSFSGSVINATSDA